MAYIHQEQGVVRWCVFRSSGRGGEGVGPVEADVGIVDGHVVNVQDLCHVTCFAASKQDVAPSSAIVK